MAEKNLPIKFFQKRTILRDNMVTPDVKRLLNTEFSFVRSKKLNIPMVY